MMRAIHRALKPGASICFYVIAAEGLSDADRGRLARRDGNDHVESPLPYDVLMTQAGFVDVDVVDVTSPFLETLRSWKREWESEADSLIELFGEEEFSRKINNRVLDIADTENGLLRRYQVYGARP